MCHSMLNHKNTTSKKNIAGMAKSLDFNLPLKPKPDRTDKSKMLNKKTTKSQKLVPHRLHTQANATT